MYQPKEKKHPPTPPPPKKILILCNSHIQKENEYGK